MLGLDFEEFGQGKQERGAGPRLRKAPPAVLHGLSLQAITPEAPPKGQTARKSPLSGSSRA